MFRLLYFALLVFMCSCNSSTQQVIRYNQLQGYEKLQWQQDSTVLAFLQNGTVSTSPVKLQKGKYTLSFFASGKWAIERPPQFIIRIDDYVLRILEVKEGLHDYKLNFEIPEDINGPLSMTFDNDYGNEKEDRDVFIHFPLVINSF